MPLTNFPNGIASFGAPVLPSTTGDVFFVAASGGSDGNDGKSPQRAFGTLDYAIGKCTANNGDMIVLLPGAHTWSASVAVDVAGVKIIGLPSNRNRPHASVTLSASDEVMNVTVAGVEIAYLRIIPVTQKAGIDFTSAADRLYVHDCSFDMATPAAHTSTKGIAVTAVAQSPDYVLIENNYFECDGAQGPAIEMGDSLQYTVRGNLIVQTAGTWAVAASAEGITSQLGLWDSNTFLTMAGATQTAGINGANLTSAASVIIARNFFGGPIGAVAKPIENFSAGDAEIIENYQSSAASGAVIITAIT